MVNFQQSKSFDVETYMRRITDAPPAALNFLAERTRLCRFLFGALIFWFFFIKKKEQEKDTELVLPTGGREELDKSKIRSLYFPSSKQKIFLFLPKKAMSHLSGNPFSFSSVVGKIPDACSYALTREFHLKDHLGNTRIVFNTSGILSENHYYPFGLPIHNLSTSTAPAGKENRYLYNGKELQDDLGLNWMDYGARFYDAGLGRWHSVDPLAEWHFNYSPYHYCFNNPTNLIDPFGLDTIQAHNLNWSQFNPDNDVILLNQVTITANKPGFIRRTFNKISRLLAKIDAGGRGETIPGGLNLVTSGNEVSPTRTTTQNPNEIETINIDNLLPAIGGAGAGTLWQQSLPIINSLSKVNDFVKETSKDNSTSDKDIKKSTGDKTDGHGKPLSQTEKRTSGDETTDTIYWINKGNDTISVAGGPFNGEIYYPGDTMSQIIRQKRGVSTRVLKENKYPQR